MYITIAQTYVLFYIFLQPVFRKLEINQSCIISVDAYHSRDTKYKWHLEIPKFERYQWYILYYLTLFIELFNVLAKLLRIFILFTLIYQRHISYKAWYFFRLVEQVGIRLITVFDMVFGFFKINLIRKTCFLDVFQQYFEKNVKQL